MKQNLSELDKKTIPSKVFYNHFFAISDHIKYTEGKYKLKRIDFSKEVRQFRAKQRFEDLISKI